MLKSIILHFVLIFGCWIFGIWNGTHAEKPANPCIRSFGSNFPKLPPFKAKQVKEDLEATHWLLKQVNPVINSEGCRNRLGQNLQGPGKSAFQPESALDPSFSAEGGD